MQKFNIKFFFKIHHKPDFFETTRTEESESVAVMKATADFYQFLVTQHGFSGDSTASYVKDVPFIVSRVP